MAVLRLELEIDSAAHPELFQLFATIDNPGLHPERMRQLASTGMIWERLRLSDSQEIVGPPRAEAPAPHLALVVSPKAAKPDALGLPVLRDEVPAAALPTRAAEALPVALAPLAAPEVAEERPASTASVPDTSPSVHMPGTRSRLMRMKNRGLFTNE